VRCVQVVQHTVHWQTVASGAALAAAQVDASLALGAQLTRRGVLRAAAQAVVTLARCEVGCVHALQSDGKRRSFATTTSDAAHGFVVRAMGCVAHYGIELVLRRGSVDAC
jgi:hypothetical protein